MKVKGTGGVSGDMFSAFRECAYPQQFEGGDILLLGSRCKIGLCWCRSYHMGFFHVAIYQYISPFLLVTYTTKP